MSENVVRPLPARALAALTLILGGAALAVLLSRGLRTDNGLETFLVAGDPAAQKLALFEEHFGRHEVLIVGVRDREVLTPEGPKRLRELEKELANALGESPAARDALDEIVGPHDFPIYRKLVREQRLEELGRLPLVVGNYLIGLDGPTPIGVLTLLLRPAGGTAERAAVVDAVQEVVRRQRQAGRDLIVAGTPLLNVTLDRASREQMSELFPLLGLVALVVLIAATRSLRGALLIASTTLLTVPLVAATLSLTDTPLNVITTALPAILLVLASSGSLRVFRAFITARYEGHPRAIAAALARRRTLRPCAIAATATAMGFLSLTLSEIAPIREMGLFAALGIAISFLLALHWLPAACALGWVPVRTAQGSAPATVPPRPLDLPPRRTLLVAVILIVGIGAGLPRLGIESTATGLLPADHPVVRDLAALREAGSGTANLEILFELPTGGTQALADPKLLGPLAHLQAELLSEPGVVGATSVTDALALIRVQLEEQLSNPLLRRIWKRLEPLDEAVGATASPAPPLRGAAIAEALLPILDLGPRPGWMPFPIPPGNIKRDMQRVVGSHLSPGKNGAEMLRVRLTLRSGDVVGFQRLVERARERAAEFAPAIGASAWHVTGLDQLMVRMQSYLIGSQIRSLLGAALLVCLVLVIGLGSFRLALLGALPNLSPLIVVYGGLGWLGIPLDVATVMVGAIALGLAVDNTVHMLSTYETLRGTPDPARRALARVWWPVVSTSTMSAAGFGVLAFSAFLPMSRFGTITGSAMIAALLGDLVLLPALLRLFRPPNRTVQN